MWVWGETQWMVPIMAAEKFKCLPVTEATVSRGKSAGAAKASEWLNHCGLPAKRWAVPDTSTNPEPFQKHPGSFQAQGWVAGPALLCLKEVSSVLIIFHLTAAWTRTPRGIVETGDRRMLLARQTLSSVRWLVVFVLKVSQLLWRTVSGQTVCWAGHLTKIFVVSMSGLLAGSSPGWFPSTQAGPQTQPSNQHSSYTLLM